MSNLSETIKGGVIGELRSPKKIEKIKQLKDKTILLIYKPLSL
jgi:hypothetical protein